MIVCLIDFVELLLVLVVKSVGVLWCIGFVFRLTYLFGYLWFIWLLFMLVCSVVFLLFNLIVWSCCCAVWLFFVVCLLDTSLFDVCDLCAVSV